MSKKIVTVFGATGFVGSSVARALVTEYQVRGVTRDPNCPKANALRNEGVQLVYADPTNRNSVQDVLTGAHACFVLTNSKPGGYEAEIAQGRIIADACAKSNISHVIYSTQLSVIKVNGLRARHMDAKAEVEQYMKDLGLPLTALILPCFYENLLEIPMRPSKIEDNFYAFEIPMGQTPLNMMCTEDTGEVIKQILCNPKPYLHKTLSVCGDKLTIKDIAGLFNKNLQPMRFKDKQVTVSQFRSTIDVPEVDDLANMFDFFCRVDQRASIDMTKKLNPYVQTLEQWLRTHIEVVCQAMNYTTESPEQQPWAL